jgi:Protein of unknown function (DUF664)
MTEVDDERFELAADSDEREILVGFLEFERRALVRKCEGLTEEQLRSRPVPSSNISLIGLVRHLATVERWYFRAVIAGDVPGSLFDHDSNEAFNAVDTAKRNETFALWAAEVETARGIVAGRELDSVGTVPPTGQRVSLRWVVTHMIDEYARHLGHADIIREAIDGRIGE